MIKTKDLPIRKGILNHLNKQQEALDVLPNYKAQVKQATILWQQKKKTKAQKAAFNRVEKALKKIAIGNKHYCNYCEANVGTTIEHIYPKGLFPNKTFVWDNYLWTCKQCNGKHKIKQFQVFADQHSSEVIKLVADQKFIAPPSEDSVFINPRVDNPLDYLKLNLSSGLFEIIATDKNSRAYKRAAYTLELLQLNQRAGLVEHRQQTYQHYIQLLNSYINIPKMNLEELKQLNYHLPPKTSLEGKKMRASILVQHHILNSQHPTIWQEMQRQYKTIPTLKKLFAAVPEALEWA